MDGMAASSSFDVSPSSRILRRDQGPRLTERDLACLRWIAQQYAIRLDQLQRLLLWHTPEVDRAKVRVGTDRLSKERTYKTLARWDALGLIEYGNILDGESRWIWLTAKGLREIGSRKPFAVSQIQRDSPSRMLPYSIKPSASHLASVL